VTADRLHQLMLNSPDVVLHASAGHVQWVSPSVAHLLGGAPEDWLGVRISEVLHPDDVARYDRLVEVIERGGVGMERLRVRAPDGGHRWVDVRAKEFIDALGRRDGAIAACRPADEAVRAETRLQRLATFDTLTGLANRSEALRRLRAVERRISNAASGDGSEPVEVAVLFCDVDHFKSVNDGFGHGVGDAVLRTVARRMRFAVREGDVVARLGGDELLVVLEGVHDLPEAEHFAAMLGNSVARPMVVGGHELHVTVSIGVTLVDPSDCTETLIDRADRAMYEAKQHGRNRVVALSA
jgi:diguanylate cyclase (GGDEF)-like protein/PAS domain S-box-containing protein